jgi:phage recombination protein Bet
MMRREVASSCASAIDRRHSQDSETMTQLVTTDGPRALALADDELIPVLRSSLYPGAKDDSIKLVLGYCRAAGLDPMQKPVHLVPMNVKKVGGGRDEYEWRDVVMPGIGLYRVQAARTGELAGIDEPEFGPEMPMPGRPGSTVPEWCRVTVYRMIGGQRVAFTAREYWLENYATAKRDSDAPNAMWQRRPRGQIAKCAEAQALRKAFPELGSQPTADETIIDTGDVIDGATGAPAQPLNVQRKSKAAPSPAPTPAAAPKAEDVTDVQPKGEAPAQAPAAPAQAPAAAPATTGGDALIGAGEVAYLKNKAKAVGADLDALLAEMGGLVLDKLTKGDFAKVKSALMAKE